MLNLIRSHIASAGHHVTHVIGRQHPKFAYTVGLTEAALPELVLAGATSLTRHQIGDAVDAGVAASRDGSLTRGTTLDVEGVGRFELADVDLSWIKELLLGALHYYDRDDVPALQLVPEESLRTIDVPDLSVPLDPEREPVWQWLIDEWPFALPPDTFVLTNLDALHGHAITEVKRWEDDHWELLSGDGSEVAKEDGRAVPFATLLAFDPTLEPLTRLEVGQGMWREYLGPWQEWR
jgi:hypothetical protein